MGRRLAHRGERVHVSRPAEQVVLATLAGQPDRFQAHAAGLAIACVARIDNLPELRAMLPTPAPDTEAALLLSLYRTLGPESLEAVSGEFAFVIVDLESRDIVVGRDYFGIAPLYFAVLPDGGLAFSSEYKALLSLPQVDVTADRGMLQYLQNSKKLPIGRTLLKSVQPALPGAVTTIEQGREGVATYMFTPLAVGDVIDREDAAVDLLRDALLGSIRRSAADLSPIGLALSGGIDSIGLAFLLRHVYPDREIHTFSSGYGDGDGELSAAAEVATLIGSIHHEIIPTPDLLVEQLPRLVWHLEDPFAGSEVVQLLEIGKVAAQHVDVVLSGQGSDSLFGGMPRYKLLRIMDRLPFIRPSLREFYELVTRGLSPRRALARLMKRAYYRDGFSPVPSILGSDYAVGPALLPTPGREFVNRAMAGGFQAGQSLDAPKYERCFAAYGLGYRAPYADVQVARAAFSISDRLKLKGLTDKYILRRTLAPFVPDRLTRQPKVVQQMRCDLAFSRALDGIADSLLRRDSVATRGFLDYEEIQALRRPDPGAPYNYLGAMRLWTVILTELWAREFLDGRGAGPEAIGDHREPELRRA
jgi:asparagine synthase (glutamine-hydrolysing)